MGDIDALKLRSSMTLFALISEADSVFHQVLERLVYLCGRKRLEVQEKYCENIYCKQARIMLK